MGGRATLMLFYLWMNMIELTFATAFVLYLGCTLAILLGIWGYSHYQAKRKKILSYEQDLYVCEYCHYAYLEDTLKKINRCPQCNSFNQKNLYKSKP